MCNDHRDRLYPFVMIRIYFNSPFMQSQISVVDGLGPWTGSPAGYPDKRSDGECLHTFLIAAISRNANPKRAGTPADLQLASSIVNLGDHLDFNLWASSQGLAGLQLILIRNRMANAYAPF